MTETAYQRIAREQRERQAARALYQENIAKEARAAIRKHRKMVREGRRERAYHDTLVSDHNHEMDT